MTGRTISHYTLLEQVGKGGMGEVYKARDERLDRIVAIKFLTEELSVDGDERQRFSLEARAASALNHSNICTIHEIDEADGRMFIVMEFIEGQSLRRRIEAGVLPIAEAVGIALQVTEGLRAAHGKGIVHRDIKPENILITAGGIAKIADFGLARTQDHPVAPETENVPGTIAYMAPEQLLGNPSGPLADIWSLGVVLYEMVAGRRPFQGDYEQAIMYSIVNERHPPASARRPDIPSSLEEIIERCLRKDPAERFQETGALLDALRRIKESPANPPPAASKSIAILPFSDLSPEQDNKYFSDGLTEEIIANLSRLRNVKIISRTSVMQFERTGKTMKQVGAELGVQYVLEGSVRKSGSDLRITAQLVDTGQDAYLWSEKYSGTMGQIFDFQEDVAVRIVKALRMRLTPIERKNLKRRSTQNTEAYQLYLRGRFFWNKRTKESIFTAIRYFEEAIQIDETYALAWAGIADSYNLLSEYESIPRHELYPKARAAADRALELDKGLAEAHTSLALLIMLNELDWANSEKEYKTAIRLNPNYPTSHHWYAEWLIFNGRTGEALREIAKAAELDPLSAAILKDQGLTLYYARDYDAAIEYAKKSLELDPNFNTAHRLLSLAYQGKKMFAEAISENRLWGELPDNRNEAWIALAQLYAASGNRAEALKLIEGLNEENLTVGNLFRGIGLVYASLGEADLAFTWLEKSFEHKAESLASLKVDPKVDGLRNDPRFASLMRKVGLEP
ncbi:MAG TPA: protein kinase [Bacteroidota bacterium]